ncbi:hypothetical protein BJ165DRAFT_644535 [Panaeolus papilionaceus]|nr:hypothetical protein BJ165DRAFT_644535 [Panaeolus papilionaceus]
MCRLLRGGVWGVDERTERERAEEREAEADKEEEGIGYLDYDDDVRGITYYFDDARDPKATAQSRRMGCKNCGVEGEHKTVVCPVRICLTCGARDEHSTRSCVTTKSCFTCGTKGHINAFISFIDLKKNCSLQDCPNGRSGSAMMSSRDQECFSSFDKINVPFTKPLLARQRKSRFFTQECSSLWRIYEYFSEARQHATLERWLEKKGLLLGKGGEAYFAGR